MVDAVNSLLECLVTALFVALFIRLMAQLGLLPVLFVSQQDIDEAGDADEKI